MVLLRCPCQEKHKIWGELWWVEGKHEWVFFDDLETSETHAEQITHCPGVVGGLNARTSRRSVPDRTGGVELRPVIGRVPSKGSPGFSWS